MGVVKRWQRNRVVDISCETVIAHLRCGRLCMHTLPWKFVPLCDPIVWRTKVRLTVLYELKCTYAHSPDSRIFHCWHTGYTSVVGNDNDYLEITIRWHENLYRALSICTLTENQLQEPRCLSKSHCDLEPIIITLNATDSRCQLWSGIHQLSFCLYRRVIFTQHSDWHTPHNAPYIYMRQTTTNEIRVKPQNVFSHGDNNFNVFTQFRSIRTHLPCMTIRCVQSRVSYFFFNFNFYFQL